MNSKRRLYKIISKLAQIKNLYTLHIFTTSTGYFEYFNESCWQIKCALNKVGWTIKNPFKS